MAYVTNNVEEVDLCVTINAEISNRTENILKNQTKLVVLEKS